MLIEQGRLEQLTTTYLINEEGFLGYGLWKVPDEDVKDLLSLLTWDQIPYCAAGMVKLPFLSSKALWMITSYFHPNGQGIDRLYEQLANAESGVEPIDHTIAIDDDFFGDRTAYLEEGYGDYIGDDILTPVVEHLNCTPEILNYLAAHKYGWIRRSVALNPRTRIRTLVTMHEENDNAPYNEDGNQDESVFEVICNRLEERLGPKYEGEMFRFIKDPRQLELFPVLPL